MERDWSRIAHFKREEWGRHVEQVDWGLIVAMDRFRSLVDAPVVIHEAWADSGHSPDSLHYRGRAVDFHVQTGRPFAEVLLCVLSIPAFMGVGWYPGWHHPGFHVDTRDSETRLLWVRKNGVYAYGPAAIAGAMVPEIQS